MENEFIISSAGIQPPTITDMQSWQSPHPDLMFHTNGWDAPSFNPMMSSPPGSIWKLGGFQGNPTEIVGSLCYSTRLSSPLKPDNSVDSGVDPNSAEFSTDPGFVERAARFSCFGGRRFNGRTGPYIEGGVEFHQGHFLSASEVKLGRVLSSPSLNGLGLGSRLSKEIGVPLGSLDQIHSMESPEESSVIESVPCCEMNPRKRKGVSNRGYTKEPENASKVIQGGVNSSAKRLRNDGDDCKDGDTESKIEAKAAEAPKDYIHVRARRGQATDSHSLAERVRREKISERMKLLQDLVPSCNKVTGKAVMLDEIINYVQSLQRQVEFLSMKLASVNTSLDHHHHHMFTGDSPSTAAALEDDLHTIVQMGLSTTSFQHHY